MTVARKNSPNHAHISVRKGAAAITPAGVRRQNVAVCAFLVLIVLAVFGRTARFDFVNYDDGDNVYENSVVENGLSLKGVGWAFTHTQVANWIPLTTLSHMMDCQFFGSSSAGGHHLVNVLWHAASAVLLFLVLRQMTGSLWRSAFVAAVFAIHPLRAESVAWVSERKDVLSAFFFMLTIGAYVRNFRQPSWIGHVAVVLFFTLGLLSKSMVATLPFVLLLLDYWPLKRFPVSGFQFAIFLRLVAEKIPLFALSVVACAAVAFVPGLAVVPPPGLVVADADAPTLFERTGNALVSYAVYLRQMIFPADLAASYPNAPVGVPAWEIFLAVVLLGLISTGVVLCRKKSPFLLVGWLWYLGMLVPVLGIVSISNDAAHADRYTYLPGIGLAIAGTWAVADWGAQWKYRRLILGGLMVATIGALMVCASRQVSYWRDSETLWKRALSCNPDNGIAHNNLGRYFAKNGQIEEAIVQYREAVASKPDFVDAIINLGNALDTEGHSDEAIVQYRRAVEIKPQDAEVNYNLGVEYFQKGELDEAIAQYRRVLEINPAAFLACNNLGIALLTQGKTDEAIAQYRKVLEINPGYAEACNNLGVALMRAGQPSGAIDEYRKALEIKPGYVDALNNLAWLLATCPQASLRDGAGALASSQKAVQLGGAENPKLLRTLAAAYAETGRYAEAAETARNALRQAVASGNPVLAGTLQNEAELYDAGMPVRDVKP